MYEYYNIEKHERVNVDIRSRISWSVAAASSSRCTNFIGAFSKFCSVSTVPNLYLEIP